MATTKEPGARARKILVGTDGSPPAIRACEFVRDLLSLAGADVRLLVVLSFTLDPYTLLGEALEDTPERLNDARRAMEEAAKLASPIFERAGAHVTVRQRFGNPAEEILEEIAEWKPDLVVTGRRGLGTAQRWMLGSVSDRVTRHAKVPVLVVS